MLLLIMEGDSLYLKVVAETYFLVIATPCLSLSAVSVSELHQG